MGTDRTPEDPGTNPRTPGVPPNPSDGSYPFLSPPDRPGELGRLGRYRVVKLLGEGGMGFVFRAEDDELCRPVALKVMRPEIATQPTYRERFLREARAAAAIKSDHVITIHEVGGANGVVFLAMEFLTGQNLADWLDTQSAPARPEAVVQVAKDVLKGLAAAHEKGLIHRDIKPANLWVETESNRIKLLDFGLTRGSGSERELTSTGQILGTPAYMSPEQARGQPVDERADLFSVGVVLYRMLTGSSPFVRHDMMATLFAVAFDEIPPVASLGAGIPDELATLIDRLLAKRPEARPESAKAALAVVAEVEWQIRTGRPTPSTQVPVDSATSLLLPRTGLSDLSRSEVYAFPDEDDPEPVPERTRRGPARVGMVGMVAMGVVVVAILIACVLMWKGGPNRGGEATGKEVATEGPSVAQVPGPSPVATAKGEKPPEPTTPNPTLDDALLPGEVLERFDYVIEGRTKMDGKRRVLKVDIAPGLKMEFVRIPSGTFIMGAPDGEEKASGSEKPQRRVEITSDFYLGKYEVTQAEYRAITGESPSHFQGDVLPVEQVSWNDAMAFCVKLKRKTGRKADLPSEAQWEYACRAGTTTPFHFGSKLNGELANCNGNFPYGTDAKGKYRETTVEGNRYLPNPWGLHHMHGNVYEWCQDYYGPYRKVKQGPNPIQLDRQSDDYRVIRGGSWGDFARNCRAATRDWGSPDNQDSSVGFRVCLTLD